MARGAGKKPDILKANENPRDKVVTSDDLSAIDKGQDFVKAGETAQISNRS